MNKKLLVIIGHPDDAEITCFGTIMKYYAAGWSCKLIMASNGNQGTSLDVDRLGECKAVYSAHDIDVTCLNLPDGYVPYNIETITAVRNEIEKFQPHTIITHYPDTGGTEHQDHATIGKAVINSILRIPHRVTQVLLAQPLFSELSDFRPNYFVNIDEWYEEKIEALKKYETQCQKYYMGENFTAFRAYLPIASCTDSKFEAFQLYSYIDQ